MFEVLGTRRVGAAITLIKDERKEWFQGP